MYNLIKRNKGADSWQLQTGAEGRSAPLHFHLLILSAREEAAEQNRVCLSLLNTTSFCVASNFHISHAFTVTPTLSLYAFTKLPPIMTMSGLISNRNFAPFAPSGSRSFHSLFSKFPRIFSIFYFLIPFVAYSEFVIRFRNFLVSLNELILVETGIACIK